MEVTILTSLLRQQLCPSPARAVGGGGGGGGRGGLPYMSYIYVPRDRVGFLRFSILK